MEKFDVVIKGKFLISFKHGIIENGIVGIKGSRIEKVFKEGELEYEAVQNLGGDDYIVMPGLVNTHTHAAMIVFRGLADDLPLFEWLQKYIWPAEGKFVREDFIRKAVPVAAAEMISTGTTTMGDIYFYQNEAAEVLAEIGLRSVLAEGIINFPTPTASNWKKQIDYTKNFIKDWIGHEVIKPSIGPHAPYTTTPEILKRSMEIGEKYNIPVQIHVAETKGEVDEIIKKFGKTPVRYLDSIGFLNKLVVAAHSVWLDDEEIDIYVDKQVGIASCPQSNAKLASGVAPHKKFIEKGAKLGLGTDGDASNNSLDMFQEMKFTALICKVISEDPTSCPAVEILRAATLTGARVLGYYDLGDLREGYLADVITVKINQPHSIPVYNPVSHLVYATKGTDVNDVVINGKIVYVNKEFKTIDIEQAMTEFSRIVQKINDKYNR